MQRIVILKVSENMAEATVGKWYVSEGDPVSAGELIVDLITEKATFEIEAEQDGVLLRQYATSKSIVPIGFTVALIGTPEDAVPEEIEEKNNSLLQDSGISISRPSGSIQTSASRAPGIKATPAARRKAKKAGIELNAVKDTLGVDGVITEKHVDEYLKNLQ